MLNELLLLTALAAAPSPVIQDATSMWTGRRVLVDIKADGTLGVENARAELVGRQVQIWIDGATLEGPAALFGTGARAIRAAKGRGEEVVLTVPLGSLLDCSGPVRLDAAEGGLRASASCLMGTGKARGETAAQAAAEATPSLNAVEALAYPSPAAAQEAPEAAASAPRVAAEAIDAPRQQAPLAAPLAGDGEPRANSLFAKPAAAETPATSPAVSAALREEKGSSVAATAAGIGLLLACAAVAALLMRRRTRIPKLVRVLETVSLGPRRSLIVARVGGETLLLAASESGISMLTPLAPCAELETATVPAAEPAPTDGYGGLVGKLLNRRAPRGPAFDELLAESAEDQELRRKLQAGLAGRVS